MKICPLRQWCRSCLFSFHIIYSGYGPFHKSPLCRRSKPSLWSLTRRWVDNSRARDHGPTSGIFYIYSVKGIFIYLLGFDILRRYFFKFRWPSSTWFLIFVYFLFTFFALDWSTYFWVFAWEFLKFLYICSDLARILDWFVKAMWSL